MVRLRCPNCGYEWEYRGKHIYATCPSCLRRVHVKRFAVEETGEVEDKRKVGTESEERLVELLKGWGFEAERDPKGRLDVVARKGGRTLVFEVKARKMVGSVQVNLVQVARALETAKKLGGETLLAVHLRDRDEWRVIPLEALRGRKPYETVEGGSVVREVLVLPEEVERAETLEEYLRKRGLL
jgi:Holliday junction resolvase/DNA-directed RNA polymerase subunit RPC12/RpoP